MKNSKYEKLELVTSLDELMEQEFIYCHGKVYHRGWFGSWQVRFALLELKRERIYKVKLKEVEDDN